MVSVLLLFFLLLFLIACEVLAMLSSNFNQVSPFSYPSIPIYTAKYISYSFNAIKLKQLPFQEVTFKVSILVILFSKAKKCPGSFKGKTKAKVTSGLSSDRASQLYSHFQCAEPESLGENGISVQTFLKICF